MTGAVGRPVADRVVDRRYRDDAGRGVAERRRAAERQHAPVLEEQPVAAGVRRRRDRDRAAVVLHAVARAPEPRVAHVVHLTVRRREEQTVAFTCRRRVGRARYTRCRQARERRSRERRRHERDVDVREAQHRRVHAQHRRGIDRRRRPAAVAHLTPGRRDPHVGARRVDHRAGQRIRVGVAAQQLHLRPHTDASARVVVAGMARVACADAGEVVVGRVYLSASGESEVAGLDDRLRPRDVGPHTERRPLLEEDRRELLDRHAGPGMAHRLRVGGHLRGREPGGTEQRHGIEPVAGHRRRVRGRGCHVGHRARRRRGLHGRAGAARERRARHQHRRSQPQRDSGTGRPGHGKCVGTPRQES